jgi:hypothetical protein
VLKTIPIKIKLEKTKLGQTMAKPTVNDSIKIAIKRVKKENLKKEKVEPQTCSIFYKETLDQVDLNPSLKNDGYY